MLPSELENVATIVRRLTGSVVSPPMQRVPQIPSFVVALLYPLAIHAGYKAFAWAFHSGADYVYKDGECLLKMVYDSNIDHYNSADASRQESERIRNEAIRTIITFVSKSISQW